MGFVIKMQFYTEGEQTDAIGKLGLSLIFLKHMYSELLLLIME